MENFQKLLELKKDLIGIDNLVVPGRVSLDFGHTAFDCGHSVFLMDWSLFPQEFIRFGCLSKLSGKGLQQRMFFLVTPLFL